MDLKKWLSLVQAFAPMIATAVNPAAGVIAGLIAHSITQAEVEADDKATGADKKAAAMQIISDSINVANIVKGTVVVDPSIIPVASDIVDDVVEAANTQVKREVTPVK